MAKQHSMRSIDSNCPITERQHVTIPVPGTTLRQCEACQDLFATPGSNGNGAPDAHNRPQSDEPAQPGPTPVGTVSVDPGANTAELHLSVDGLRKLANDVIQEIAKTNLGTDIPHMIAFTMIGVAYLKHSGMGHNQIMEVVSLAYNGDVTGLFALDFGVESESGGSPE